MSSIKRKIALIGGGGYIGKHLGNKLASSYHLVYTSRTKKDNNLQLDLTQPETFEQLRTEGPFEIIFILASSMQGLGTTLLKEEYLHTDTIGLAGFLQFISTHQLSSKIIFISSMTVYGLQNTVPVKEDGLLAPLSTYGLSKVLAERLIDFYSRSTPVKSVVLRIPGIYGGERNSGFIYNTIKKCLHNEAVTLNTSTLGYWETMHVDDCCETISTFIERYDWNPDLTTFNIGYGTKTDIVDCSYMIRELLNSSSEISISGEKGYIDFYLDNTRMQNYAPLKNDYKQSLQRYIKNFVL